MGNHFLLALFLILSRESRKIGALNAHINNNVIGPSIHFEAEKKVNIVVFYNYSFRMVEEADVNTFNSQSSSLIKLNNGTVLYLREVNKFLALVCILREENFQKQGKF